VLEGDVGEHRDGQAEFDHVTEMTNGFGKLGVPAEAVGEHAAKRTAGYLASTAAVGPYTGTPVSGPSLR
jgi:RNA 3'-terminal phosphate cyclase